MPVPQQLVYAINLIVDFIEEHNNAPPIGWVLERCEPVIREVEEQNGLISTTIEAAMRGIRYVGSAETKVALFAGFMYGEEDETRLRSIGSSLLFGEPGSKDTFKAHWARLSPEARTQISAIAGGASWMTTADWKRKRE